MLTRDAVFGLLMAAAAVVVLGGIWLSTWLVTR